MKDLVDMLQAIAFTVFVISAWFILPFLLLILATGLCALVFYLIIKDHREHNDNN